MHQATILMRNVQWHDIPAFSIKQDADHASYFDLILGCMAES